MRRAPRKWRSSQPPTVLRVDGSTQRHSIKAAIMPRSSCVSAPAAQASHSRGFLFPLANATKSRQQRQIETTRPFASDLKITTPLTTLNALQGNVFSNFRRNSILYLILRARWTPLGFLIGRAEAGNRNQRRKSLVLSGGRSALSWRLNSVG